VDKPNLGVMLVAANLIDEVQMRVALAEQQRTGKRFGSTLVELKFIDENVLAAFLSKQIDIPCISLLHIDVPKKILRKLPAKLARELHAIPIRHDGDRYEVAMLDPTDTAALQKLQEVLGQPIAPLIAPQSSLEKMIERFYSEETDDDTQVARRREAAIIAADPIFLDLIEELENGDYDQRLTRIEEGLNQIWTLLEKILRHLETPRQDADRFTTRR
jgi:MSHA biogenesis protein MshE